MQIVFLRPAERFADAARHLAGHRAWLQQALADETLLLSGNLRPAGGAMLARAASADALRERLAQDPFVAHGVVSVEIHEVTPALTAQALQFLRGDAR